MCARIEQLLELHSTLWFDAFRGYKERKIAETSLLELSEMDSNAKKVVLGQHLRVVSVKGGWSLSWWEATPQAWQASSMYDTLTAFLIQELHKEDYL